MFWAIPHETVNFDDQDPFRIHKKIKKLIQEKNKLYNRLRPNIQKLLIWKNIPSMPP